MAGHSIGFLLLGTVGVEVDTHVCRMGSGPQRVILAALLLKPNQVLSAEHLSTLIWDDTPPTGPRQALNNHVMRLRKALGPAAAERIRTQSPGYTIEVRPGELDLHRFDAMRQDADTAIGAGDWARAAGLLDSALALWRGDALTDVPSRQLQLEAREHLAERRFRAQQARVDALLHLGRFDEAIGHVRHLMADRPLDEGLPGRLMAALYGSGRQSDALAAFQRIRDTLDDELGIEPGRELRELQRAVLTQQPAAALVELATGRAPVVPASAPPALTPPPPEAPFLVKAPAIGDAVSQYSNDQRGDQHAVNRRNGRLPLRPTVIAGGIVAATVFALVVGHIAGDHSAAQPVSADGKVGYVARVGSDAQDLPTSSVDVPVLHATSGNQTLIVSITLSSTSAGTVTVSDSVGNSYSMIGDIVDDYRHRTMLFAVFDAKPLSTSDQISAHYPKSSKYHIAIDAFRGISSAGAQTGSASLYGHNTEFTTSAALLPCGPGDLLLTAIATNSGTAPGLVEGWHTLPELKLSSYRQTTGFRFIEAPGKCSATGTTTAQWEVVAVILHR